MLAAPIGQRAPAGRSSPSAPTAVPATRAASASTVRVDRSSESAAAAAAMDANAFTSGDTIVMPPSHGPLDRGRGQALLAHELVHISQQRRLGSSLPPEHTGAGQQLEREARSAETLAERVAARSPEADMPVARAAARRSPAAPSTHSSEVREATELALAAGSRAGIGGSLELPTAPAADAVPPPQRAAASGGAPAGMTAAFSAASAGEAKPKGDEEFEELARRLYERLRLRLKRELLLDRERSGFLADPR